MALESQLFAGDPQLEAAAVSDPAHIVPGARGGHVRKIQLALIQLDGAAIDPDGVYGPKTAAAVLAYKRSRNIINRSRQTQADDIVGKMTMAALDSEMRGKQPTVLRSGCDYRPRSSPGGLLLSFSVLGPAAASGRSIGGLVDQLVDPFQLAQAAAPAAFVLSQDARRALNAVVRNDGSESAGLGSQALTRHFKVSDRKDFVDTAKKLEGFLQRISAVLLVPKTVFRSGVGGGAFAETPTPRNGKIFVLPPYVGAGKLMRSLVLVHEAFHNLDDFHQDFGGNPAIDRGTRYHKNDAGTQIHNAFAMSQFVLHIHGKRERFLEDNE
jgi:peptidoglycan hydrolase-like protein with peptidoglycan-binding domain